MWRRGVHIGAKRMGKDSRAERQSPTERGPRMFVEGRLEPHAIVAFGAKQSHYLGRVMRLREGGSLRVFNGKDGEWLATIGELARRGGNLVVTSQLRHQAPTSHQIRLCVAPIRRSRFELIVEKAVELGVSSFLPIVTMHTVASLPDIHRLARIAIEAAEQSERLDVPVFEPAMPFEAYVGDESARNEQILAAVERTTLSIANIGRLKSPIDVLIGPEGGFALSEVERLWGLDNTHIVSLGRAILRSETAALVALSWLHINMQPD
ncbi:MAG: RsmE family RNA methyltransferase [Pseudomonadota bacterium]